MDEERYREMFSQLHSSVHEEDIFMTEKRAKRPRMAAILLAAAMVLALAVGAAAAYSYRIQDLVLNKNESPSADAPAEINSTPVDTAESEKSQSIHFDPIPENTDTISLQGFVDSPEYQAMKEWSEYEHGYDRDGEILQQVGNASTPWDEKYSRNGYRVYSQEMADKVDEIVRKYGLVLHTGSSVSADMTELRNVFGAFTSTDRWGGYYYEDGTFQFDGAADLGDYGPVDYQFRRTMKGVFDTVGLNVADAEQYEQWEYDTACGERVLLALGPNKALILADLENCFVAVNVLSGTDTVSFDPAAPGPMSREALEMLADTFDYSIL